MRKALGVALLAAVLPAWAAEAPEGFAGATAERLEEPVFDGHLVLYHAGEPGAEPVVLVHGLGQNGARDWSGLIPELVKANYEVFAFDLPGFGQSDRGDALYSPENYAKVIEKVVAPRVARPFTLIGHSLGGAISLGYSAAYPQRVKRLVLVDMAGVLYGPVYADALARSAMSEKGAPAGKFDSMLRSLLGKMQRMGLDKQMILNTPALRRKFLRGDPTTIAMFALGNTNFSGALRSIAAPTLLVWGEDDPIAPLRTGAIAGSLIKGARLAVLPGVGHAPMMQAAARFNRIVLDELAGKTTLPLFAVSWDTPPAGTRQTCDREDGRRFSGDIGKLTLIDCTNAEITHARVGELRVLASDVKLVDAQVKGGLYALRSTLEFTGGSVTGTLKLDAVDFDAAGTRFESSSPVASNLGRTPLTLRMSVTEVKRGARAPKYVHDFVKLNPGAQW